MAASPLVRIHDVPGLPSQHRKTGCAASHAAVNGGEAFAPWANKDPPGSGQAAAPLARKRASLSFVCPATRPSCLMGNPVLFYIPSPCYTCPFIPLRTSFSTFSSAGLHQPIRRTGTCYFSAKVKGGCQTLQTRPCRKSSFLLRPKRISAARFAGLSFCP